jgi:hypothetical protein
MPIEEVATPVQPIVVVPTNLLWQCVNRAVDLVEFGARNDVKLEMDNLN